MSNPIDKLLEREKIESSDAYYLAIAASHLYDVLAEIRDRLPEPAPEPPQACGAESYTGWPCHLPKGHSGPHSVLAKNWSGHCKAISPLRHRPCTLEDGHTGVHVWDEE